MSNNLVNESYICTITLIDIDTLEKILTYRKSSFKIQNHIKGVLKKNEKIL